MCSANHRRPRREASHRVTIRLLASVNYRDRVVFPKTMQGSRLKRTPGIAATPVGLNTRKAECLDIGPRGFSVCNAAPAQVVNSQTVSDCKGDGFAPPLDDSLRAAVPDPQKAAERRHSELA